MLNVKNVFIVIVVGLIVYALLPSDPASSLKKVNKDHEDIITVLNKSPTVRHSDTKVCVMLEEIASTPIDNMLKRKIKRYTRNGESRKSSYNGNDVEYYIYKHNDPDVLTVFQGLEKAGYVEHLKKRSNDWHAFYRLTLSGWGMTTKPPSTTSASVFYPDELCYELKENTVKSIKAIEPIDDPQVDKYRVTYLSDVSRPHWLNDEIVKILGVQLTDIEGEQHLIKTTSGYEIEYRDKRVFKFPKKEAMIKKLTGNPPKDKFFYYLCSIVTNTYRNGSSGTYSKLPQANREQYCPRVEDMNFTIHNIMPGHDTYSARVKFSVHIDNMETFRGSPFEKDMQRLYDRHKHERSILFDGSIVYDDKTRQWNWKQGLAKSG